MVEVFVEQDVVAPVGIVLESVRSANTGRFPLRILQKDMR